MKPLDITLFCKINKNDIKEIIRKNNGKILIDYPMSSINRTNSPVDIVSDYIDALYISEELGKYASSITATKVSSDKFNVFCRYEIIVKKIEQFTVCAEELFNLFYGDQEDDDILIERSEKTSEFAEEIETKIFLCPEIADDYYANWINSYYEIDSESDGEFLEEELSKFPEREYYYWESACGKAIGQTFYTSTDSWIVPRSSDIKILLSKYSGLSDDESYESAAFFSIDKYSYLINAYSLVYFPFSSLMRAKKCSEIICDHENDAKPFISSEILTYSSYQDYLLEKYNVDLQANRPQTKYLLSGSGEAIIVEEEDFYYVFFPDKVKTNNAVNLYEETSKIFSSLSQYAGINSQITLNWDSMDDEKFENFCYDIIYHTPKFDNTTIRKMGKSRSRDGGRDIVVYTRERIGQDKKLFIFQCKFTKTGSSLTTQKVTNISDTIVQYKAEGYGLMTPVVIDSALYDRVDAICEKFNVENDNWSILEIERFIARHPTIKERYFQG